MNNSVLGPSSASSGLSSYVICDMSQIIMRRSVELLAIQHWLKGDQVMRVTGPSWNSRDMSLVDMFLLSQTAIVLSLLPVASRCSWCLLKSTDEISSPCASKFAVKVFSRVSQNLTVLSSPAEANMFSENELQDTDCTSFSCPKN